MIVIGCGGSGGKVVAGLRQQLEQELVHRGWEQGLPDAWQLLYIDTPTVQEVHTGYGQPVPDADYVSTAAGQTTYRHIDEALADRAMNHAALERLVGWRPPPNLQFPISSGAGQWRAVGRAIALHRVGGFAERFKAALDSCASGLAELQQLTERLNGDAQPPSATPLVIVISSMAGGTGAGIFIDVCDAVKAIEPYVRVGSVLFTAEVFQHVQSGSGLQANTVATLAELMAGSLDRNRSTEALFAGHVDTEGEGDCPSGPDFTFLVGMETFGGQQLTSASQSYRVVTDTLVAAFMSPKVHHDLFFRRLTGWNGLQVETPWAIGNSALNSYAARVSSFGSSRLSVGSKLFGEYAVHRLAGQILDFLTKGHLDHGRQHLEDASATQAQIIDFFVSERGLTFVSDCGLRELNDPNEDHEQVLNVVLPPEVLDEEMRSWWRALVSQLAASGGQTQSQWQTTIETAVPPRMSGLISRIERQMQQGIATLVNSRPTRVLEETSQIISELGVPVARELVAYAADHLRHAAHQSRHLAELEEQSSRSWTHQVAQTLSALPRHGPVSFSHPLVGGDDGAARQATVLAYRRIQSIAYTRTADFLDRFADQVLDPLVEELDDLAQQLTAPNIRAEISALPDKSGVPARFLPSQLDFCLIDVDDWPQLFESLVRETAEQDHNPHDPPARSEVTVRRMIGGGGFTVTNGDRVARVPTAIEVSSPWTMRKSVQFDTTLTIKDLTARARRWTQRRNYPIGKLLTQDLRTYLEPEHPDGSPKDDYGQRLARFQDQLSAALGAASPLVAIDPAVFRLVHPLENQADSIVNLAIQPLPVRGEARRVAIEVLASSAVAPMQPDRESWGDYFDDSTTAVESVLLLSQIWGAVHPAAIRSLTEPIAAEWQRCNTSSTAIHRFWQFRRARILKEATPVAPDVLDAMIRGWFIGRALGLIPDPSPEHGFVVRDHQLPWPLLRCGSLGDGLTSAARSRDWLPAILETLGLAFMLVPTEPDILKGYDALYQIGDRGYLYLDRWVDEGTAYGVVCQPRVEVLSSTHQRAKTLRDHFGRIENYYSSQHETTLLTSEPETFGADFGYSLYPRFIAAAERLAAWVPDPEEWDVW